MLLVYYPFPRHKTRLKRSRRQNTDERESREEWRGERIKTYYPRITSGAIQWLISVCEEFNHRGQKQSSRLKQERLPLIGVFNKGTVKKELRV